MPRRLHIISDDTHPRESEFNPWALSTFDSKDGLDRSEHGHGWENIYDALEDGFGLRSNNVSGAGGLLCLLSRRAYSYQLVFRGHYRLSRAYLTRFEGLINRGGWGDSTREVYAKTLGVELSVLHDCIGLMTIRNHTLRHVYGSDNLAVLPQAFERAKCEIDRYSNYMAGEVYGALIRDSETGKVIEWKGGFFGDPRTSGLLDAFQFDELANDGQSFLFQS